MQREIIWRLFVSPGFQRTNPEWQPSGVADVGASSVVPSAAESPRVSTPEDPERNTARLGKCLMNPARGTKCKACGKVHPL